jgi:hypothetical protein
MVNRQTRSPGEIRRFDQYGRVSTDLPSYAVDTGDAWRALSDVAGKLGSRLGELADKAAAREGELAGLDAGAASGAAYLKMQAAQAGAAAVNPRGTSTERGLAAKSYYMRVHGLSEHAAAGIVGNLMQESSLNPKAINRGDGSDGSDRIGVGQWNQGRAKALRAFAAARGKPVDDFFTQLDFVVHELGSNEEATGKRLAAATSIDEATAAFIGFERPQGWSAENPRGGHGWANRLKYAMALGGRASSAPVPAAAQPAAGSTPAVPVLPTAPLALRRDGTIYGEAYDRAASNANAWRLQAAVETEMQAAYEANPDDPAALATSLAAVQEKYGRELSDPELQEGFTRFFVQKSEAYLLDARTKAEAKMRAEEEVAAFEGIAAQRLSIERQAVAVGANAKGDEIIEREVQRSARAIDGAVAGGSLTPAQGSKLKADLAETAATGRVRGVYEALDTPEKKEEFALGLLDEWTAGKGPLARLSYDTVKSLSQTLFADARGAAEQKTTAQKIEATRIERLIDDDIAATAATGKGLDPKESGLTADRVSSLLGGVKLEEWRQKRELAQRAWQATVGMETQSTAELASRLTILAEAAKSGKPGAADAAIALAAAQEKAAAVLKERGTDPLGQAARAGAIELKAIDFTSPEALAESLAKRHADATAVAGLHRSQPVYFQPSERAYLARALGENAQIFPEFALQLQKTFGADAPKALAELGEDAPMMAHAAGITLATGNNSVAVDVAEALAAKKEGLFKAKMPETQKAANAAGALLGSSLAYLPRLRASTIATANLLFEADANRTGFDPAEIDKEDSPARASYMRALDRALGGTTVKDVKFGGIGEVNGFPIVVPHDMPAERPQELLEGITDEELAQLAPIGSANGVAIQASQLRSAHLVSFQDGRYRVMLGDPNGPDPQRVLGADGRDWILEIHKLDGFRQASDGATPQPDFGPMP